jgi:ubiquinone biosynthesis protein
VTDLGEQARCSRWIAETPGLAHAVALWEHQVAGRRSAVNDGARRLARPGLLPPARLLRHSVALTAAPLEWMLTRLPDDVGAARPLEQPGAWVEASTGYLLREQLANLGPVAAELARIITDCEEVLPDFVTSELQRRPLPDAPMPREMSDQIVRRALPGHAIAVGDLLFCTPVSQLHQGQLDDGAPILIRVARPGVDRDVRDDARIAATVLSPFQALVPALAAIRPLGIIELISRQLEEASDVRNVALNAIEIGLVVEQLELDRLVVARPVPDLVTSSVAIFELPPTATGVHPLEQPIPEPGREANDRPDARQIGRLTIEAALTSGTFLADVRPEQVVAMPDGRVLLIGCDAIGRLDLATRRALLDLLPALVARDPVGQMGALQDLGIAPPGTAADRLAEELAGIPPTNPLGLLTGEGGGLTGVTRQTLAVLLRHGVTPPLELVQLARAVLSLRTVLDRTDASGGLLAAFAPLLGTLPELRARLG